MRQSERKKAVIAIVSGYCASAEDDMPDFHDLGADIEQQFHELSALDDAIFIDWFPSAGESSHEGETG